MVVVWGVCVMCGVYCVSRGGRQYLEWSAFVIAGRGKKEHKGKKEERKEEERQKPRTLEKRETWREGQ